MPSTRKHAISVKQLGQHGRGKGSNSTLTVPRLFVSNAVNSIMQGKVGALAFGVPHSSVLYIIDTG